MVDTKRIQEIKEETKQITEEGLAFFGHEFEKFGEKLSNAIKEYHKESVKISKALAEKSRVFAEYEKKTKEIKEEYTIYSTKVSDLNEKSEANDKKEDELLKLHKVLVNKGKSLNARETEIKEKERRLNDR